VATGAGPKQKCTQTEGMVAYFEVADQLKSGVLKSSWDDKAHAPFAYDEKGKVWFSYDDERSMNQKLDFIEAQGLGGAMIWEVDTDDFHHGYPLISLCTKRLQK